MMLVKEKGEKFKNILIYHGDRIESLQSTVNHLSLFDVESSIQIKQDNAPYPAHKPQFSMTCVKIGCQLLS